MLIFLIIYHQLPLLTKYVDIYSASYSTLLYLIIHHQLPLLEEYIDI